MVLGWFFLTKSSKLIKLGKGSSVSHPGLGCFRHLWHHFTHCMGGCNVSLTLPCILILYYFNLLCQYVLRFFFRVDRPFSNGGQLMCHEDASPDANLLKTVLVLLGHLMPSKIFVNEISAPLRGLIM
jgi:hypothetical protein